MATLFMDNFEIYGDTNIMLDGMYASLEGAVDLTYLEGLPTLFLPSPISPANGARKVLPAIYTTLFTGVRMRMINLPLVDQRSLYFELRDVGNVTICSYGFDSTGRVVVKRGVWQGGSEIGRSVSPVLGANTWHHFETKWVINGSTGSVQIRVDDNDIPAINLTNVNTVGPGTSGGCAQIFLGNTGGFSSFGYDGWMTDLHVWDETGDRNNDFLGDVAVSTLWPNEDIETGWTPNYRHKIEQGILALTNGTASVIYCEDANALDIGANDYTLETFIRFDSLPTGSNRVPIFQKWYEDNNTRSYELSKCGPGLNDGNIEFRISTGGTAGSVQTIISQPWEPETDRWYHVAVSRGSGETMLFIDGIMQGVPQTDANTYFATTSRWVFGGGLYSDFGTQGNTIPGLSVRGWFDETRFTNGFCRYDANFTPTTVPFGRTVGTDPEFADVVFLAGYDNGIADESSFARGVGSRGSAGGFAFANFPDDGFFQYQTINAEDTLSGGPPRDDTNISASLYHAAGILTLDTLPIDGDEVTIGDAAPETYKFVDTLVDPFDVLIEATIALTLRNLVDAINEGPGSGTEYGTGTTAHTEVYAEQLPGPQMKAIALLAGTAGNDIATTYTGDGVWDDATLTGGADIPGPSSFRFTRMPPGVTTIRSIQMVTRAYKTESGPAKMKTNFVGPAGAIDEGQEVSLPVEPAYRFDIFEEDPDTTGPITPATLVQGRVQFDRTE